MQDSREGWQRKTDIKPMMAFGAIDFRNASFNHTIQIQDT